MKFQLRLLLFLSVFAVSCKGDPKPDDSKTTFKAEKITVKGVPVTDSSAVVSMTWKQATHYAAKSGMKIFYLLFVLAVTGFVVAILRLTSVNGPQLTAGYGGLLLFFLGGAIYSLYGPIDNVKSNNTRKVPIELYRKTVNTFGDTRPFWDSLYNNNLMIGANSK